MTYPFEDVLLVFLVLHEEADLPAGASGISIHLPALRVVPQGKVTDVKHLTRVYLCQNHLVPYHNLCREVEREERGEEEEGKRRKGGQTLLKPGHEKKTFCCRSSLILHNYHHGTKLYWKISRVCCHLYCCECVARVTMPTATNE